VGEAEEMHSAIIGQEVDEGLVRSRQIVDQISQLVKEDADSAASIVQNWLKDES
jgi:flagellar biosynthesis/type III secretory pathway M-ring protein FliF/YscJ